MIRKIVDLFEPGERMALAGLCVMIVVVALVQTIGVASIMPFMTLVSNPEMITDKEWIRRLYDTIGFTSTRTFLFFVGLIVLGIMALSNALTALEHWMMSRFVWRKQDRLSVQLLARYLREPYTFYLNQNTSALARNVLTEVSEAVNGVLMPCMKLLAQSVVILCMLALLLLVDTRVALLAAFVLGGGHAAIYTIVRHRQTRLGKVRRRANEFRFRTAAEALGSIKETKVLGTETEFLRRFSVWSRPYSNANASNAIVRDLPRYALETLAFGGVLLMVLYVLHTREDFGQAVAVTSLYALAGYRLMPALQQVFRAVAQIRFFRPALDGLHADLRQASTQPGGYCRAATDGKSITCERKIVLDGIRYRYPGGEEDVVCSVSLEIRKNTSVALVGSTGCGKTTLVDILLGLLEPQEGSIHVDDVALCPDNISAFRKQLGYVPQHIYLCDDTVVSNIAFGVPHEQIDLEAVERAARIAHLHDFVMSLAQGYETVVGERGVRLSGGQRQRIGIARALYRDPDLLVLDEATSSLDGITEDAVIEAIRDLSRKKTIILVAHRLSTVRHCDVVYLFDQGRIVASGTYVELLRTSPLFRAMAKVAVEQGPSLDVARRTAL